MDPQHRRLYVQWCQSERVKLTVGDSSDSGKSSPSQTFLLPRDFLLRRSRTFRDLMEERSARETAQEPFSLPETSIKTMEDFFVWTFSPQPKIDYRASFDEVVRLGIFGWRYQIAALSNQITDMIRRNLADGEWQLEASLVDGVYEAAPSGSPLREVIRAALSKVPRTAVEGDGHGWKATFLKHAQLGWDYIEAGGAEWTPKNYLSGVCRFHDHDGLIHVDSLSPSCDGCPYAQEDCYPREIQTKSNGVDKGNTEEPTEDGDTLDKDTEQKKGADVDETISEPLPAPITSKTDSTDIFKEGPNPTSNHAVHTAAPVGIVDRSGNLTAKMENDDADADDEQTATIMSDSMGDEADASSAAEHAVNGTNGHGRSDSISDMKTNGVHIPDGADEAKSPPIGIKRNRKKNKGHNK